LKSTANLDYSYKTSYTTYTNYCSWRWCL